MAINYVRNIITSGYNLAKINDNFAKIETALQDAVSRSGTSPNQMNSDFDMNSNDILNVKDIDVETLTLNGELVQPGSLINALLISNALSELGASSLDDEARNNIKAAFSGLTITAGTGLAGGGTLEANRTILLNSASIASLLLADNSVQFSPNLDPIVTGTDRVRLGARDKRIETVIPGSENNGWLIAVSPIGRAAAVFGTRSSDNPTVGDMGTYASGNFVIHDSDKFAYAGYDEIRVNVGAGAGHGREIGTINFKTPVAVDPFNISAVGLVDGLRLSSGRGDTPTNTDISAFINILKVGAKALTGINFGSDSLSTNKAINFAHGHQISWYSAANTVGTFIRADGAHVNMIFGSAGLFFQDTLGNNLIQQTSSQTTIATPVSAPIYSQGEVAVNLVNGANNNVAFAVGQLWCQGVTGAFSITGLVAKPAGTEVTILNDTGQNLTISSLSGSSTAANQIWTPTGADMVSTGNCSVVLRYSVIKGKWMVVSFQA